MTRPAMKNEDAAAVRGIMSVLLERAIAPSVDAQTKADDARRITDHVEAISEEGAQRFHGLVGQLIAIVEIAEARFDQSERHAGGGALADGTPFVAIGNDEMPYPDMAPEDLIEWLQAGRPAAWSPGQKH